MAGAAVTFLLDKLGNFLLQEALLLHGIHDQVDWLRTELRRMGCFLQDADARARKGDEGVRNWVAEVRDVAHQAEDIIDTFVLKIERRRQQQRRRRRRLSGCVHRYALIPLELQPRREVVRGIEKIRAKTRGISESRSVYGIANLGEQVSNGGALDEGVQARRKLSPYLDDDDSVIVGFDADKRLIADRLLDPDVRSRSVVSIVGMGGLGKTTLAKKVYNSSEIQSAFQTSVWISVSQDFRVGDLVNLLIMKVLGITRKELEKRVADQDEDYPKKQMKDFLKERKYLIVMDDIWTTQVWEQIKAVLPNSMNGSRVLFTTRFMEVAKSADPSIPPYELPLLSRDQSWVLLLRKVFPGSRDVDPTCPKELEDIGQRLIKRCGGLPLAVVVLGGLLSRKDPTPTAWLEVADNMDWESTRDGKDCLQILALSYNDLPNQYLKSCFLYVGSFPEDSDIKACTLIRLWMAEGFIPQREKQTMEATAKGYLDELVQRCLVQVAGKSLTHGRVSSIRIHDLLRDLCILEAKENGLFRIFSNSCYNSDVEHNAACRRLVLEESSSSNIHYSTSKVRTILGFNITYGMHGFRLLRVIHIQNSSFRSSLKEITSLIHLRYLGIIDCYGGNLLPSSIGNLCNLHTLDVRGSRMILPKTLWEIETMRHICTSESVCVQSLSVGSLRNLQCLKIVDAKGGWMERDLAKLSSLQELAITKVSVMQWKALYDALQKLNHLTSLSVHQAESASIPNELFTSLSNHCHLRKLRLIGQLVQKLQFPDILAFPRNLSCLKLEECLLEKDPMPTLERLLNLTTLELSLHSFVGKEMVCSAVGFPRLQHLRFLFLDNLECWTVEGGGMPNLTHLTIDYCRKLKVVPDGLEHVASFQKLVVKGMPSAFEDRLQEGGGDWHKIRHVSSIIISDR